MGRIFSHLHQVENDILIICTTLYIVIQIDAKNLHAVFAEWMDGVVEA